MSTAMKHARNALMVFAFLFFVAGVAGAAANAETVESADAGTSEPITQVETGTNAMNLALDCRVQCDRGNCSAEDDWLDSCSCTCSSDGQPQCTCESILKPILQ